MAEQFLVLKKAVGDLKISAPTTIEGQTLVFEEGKPVKIDGNAVVIIDRELISVPMSFAKAQVENNNAEWQTTGHPEYEIISGPEPTKTRTGRGGEA